MTGWCGFLMFLIIFFLVDSYLYVKGHNTLFWKYKTKNELEHQRIKLGLSKCKENNNNASKRNTRHSK